MGARRKRREQTSICKAALLEYNCPSCGPMKFAGPTFRKHCPVCFAGPHRIYDLGCVNIPMKVSGILLRPCFMLHRCTQCNRWIIRRPTVSISQYWKLDDEKHDGKDWRVTTKIKECVAQRTINWKFMREKTIVIL